MLRDLLFKTENDRKYLDALEDTLAKSEIPGVMIYASVREIMGDREYYGTAIELCQRGRPVHDAARQMLERASCLQLMEG